MAAAFPHTPVTLVTQLEKSGLQREQVWSTFFNLYHRPIELTVENMFRRFGWHQIPPEVLEETVADVVVSLLKTPMIYDPAKGRFRNILRQLAYWRVCDRIKASTRDNERLIPLENTTEPSFDEEPSAQLIAQEEEALQESLLAAMLEEVRASIGPRTYLMFELVRLQETPPAKVADLLGVKRNVVDNAVYRVTERLRALAQQPPYNQELF